MSVLTLYRQMNRRTEAVGQRPEKVRNEFRWQFANLIATKFTFKHKVSAPGNIEGDLRPRCATPSGRDQENQ